MRRISNYVLTNSQIARLQEIAERIGSNPKGSIETTVIKWAESVASSRQIKVFADKPEQRMVINTICKF